MPYSYPAEYTNLDECRLARNETRLVTYIWQVLYMCVIHMLVCTYVFMSVSLCMHWSIFMLIACKFKFHFDLLSLVEEQWTLDDYISMWSHEFACYSLLYKSFLFFFRSVVTETLKGVEPDRRCFRMVGGVLVERTVNDVLPALINNKEQVWTNSYCENGVNFFPASPKVSECIQ